ncbi:hypothetical protein HYV43_06290 [Candidatus Micrarchaeota archaeon]|nr:hypothetical protein [Candidatus Micrarchaeota archaeon]
MDDAEEKITLPYVWLDRNRIYNGLDAIVDFLYKNSDPQPNSALRTNKLYAVLPYDAQFTRQLIRFSEYLGLTHADGKTNQKKVLLSKLGIAYATAASMEEKQKLLVDNLPELYHMVYEWLKQEKRLNTEQLSVRLLHYFHSKNKDVGSQLLFNSAIDLLITHLLYLGLIQLAVHENDPDKKLLMYISKPEDVKRLIVSESVDRLIHLVNEYASALNPPRTLEDIESDLKDYLVDYHPIIRASFDQLFRSKNEVTSKALCELILRQLEVLGESKAEETKK